MNSSKSIPLAPPPFTLAQSKERKGSNFAIWQPYNRTLQIFLHEMRAALEQEVVEQDGKKTYRVHKILDDLEYVAQNMSNGSPASAAMPMKAAATGQNICFLCKVNQVSQNPS